MSDPQRQAIIDQFRRAVAYVRAAPVARQSNDRKLQYYANYKQATLGDVRGERPGMLNVEARAKFDAWATLKGSSPTVAMVTYVRLLSTDAPGWQTRQ